MMISEQVELQDIFTAGSQEYELRYRSCNQQRKVINAIRNCRTQAMGQHTAQCDNCGKSITAYNSCRNRHCPKCQFSKQTKWVEQLENNLLPVAYFHVVFTLPQELHEIVYKTQQVAYSVLLKSAGKTLEQVAGYREFLGAQTGCVAVLHTWGQNLMYHPHVHMLVPAGGMDEDGMEWVPSSKKFFVPVKVLSKVFRSKFFGMLEKTFSDNNIGLPSDYRQLKDRLYEKEWVVYTKKPFKGPGQLLTYLGRYTHRVAISNNRILSHCENKVTFRWKDYSDHNKWKTMELDTCEFMRRFLLHVLPCGFYKIRYYGIFANANRKIRLQHCMLLITRLTTRVSVAYLSSSQTELKRKCPFCQKGHMYFVGLIKDSRMAFG